ncbi:MAG TPA: DUF4143 domain-containing protein [Acidimicrobiia bacterium]
MYRSRVLDAELESRLRSAGAVLIEGPKACGKTETARRQAASEVLLDVDTNARAALDVDPMIVLDGPAPRLVDEWQLAPDIIWNRVRRLVDERESPGQFILTGSAAPDDNPRRHSGAGRFATLRMRPMSLFELGRSTGEISIRELLDGALEVRSGETGLDVTAVSELVSVGGWPANLGLTTDDALQANRDYLTQIEQVDISLLQDTRRDPRRIGRLLRSLARNVATEVSVSVLAADAAEPGAAPLARTTVYDYLSVLERLMLVEDQPAWSVHLRSAATLRKRAKRHFVDPSLAVAALGASPTRLLDDLHAFGYLFESLVVRDLRVLSGPLGGEVFHYRDSNGTEVDIIVMLPGGTWGAFEVKLGAGQIDTAAESLHRFMKQIDTTRVGEPAVLGVVTIAGFGYTRPDGISVIPVAALAP